MSETSRIRQLVILIDNKVYKFDVNSQISLKNLRKIVSAAANIGHKVFKFYQNNKEINAPDITTIDKLFPKDKIIEINVCSIKEIGPEPISINIKQGLSCKLHLYKFPYMYCYNCSISICSMCVQSEEHINHNIIDKHDYLQNSEILVTNIFQDMKKLFSTISNDQKLEIESIKSKLSRQFIPSLLNQIKSVETKLINIINYFLSQLEENKNVLYSNTEILKTLCSDGLEELKYQLKIQDIMVDEDIFNTLDEKIRQISKEKNRIFGEGKKYEDMVTAGNLISSAIESLYRDISLLIDEKLKSFFREEFKSKVIPKNSKITKDEVYNILFSDFKKLNNTPKGTNLKAFSSEKHVSSEKNKNKSFKELKINIMTTFDIDNNFDKTEDTMPSDKHINSRVYEKFVNIDKDEIKKNIVDKPEIISFTGNNNNGFDPTSNNISRRQSQKEFNKQVCTTKDIRIDTGSLDSQMEIPMEIFKNEGYKLDKSNDENRKNELSKVLIDDDLNENNDKYSKNFTLKEELLKRRTLENDQIIEEKYSKTTKMQLNDNQLNKNLLNLNEKENSIINKGNNNNKFDPKLVEKIVEDIKKKPEEVIVEDIEKMNVVINLKPNTNNILVYEGKKSKKIIKKFLEISKSLNYALFPQNFAYTNFDQKIYITGGLIEGKDTNLFFIYDYSLDKTIRLSDMNVPRHNHSTLVHNNHLYSIGGTNNKTIEKYSLLNYNWKRLEEMNEEREHPITMIREDYLYIFFGINKNGDYSKSVERINVNIAFSKSEYVNYTNDDKIKLGLIGCGFIRYKPDEVLFLGGKYNNSADSKTGFFFNFDKNSFRASDIQLEERLFFVENELQELDKERYGNFNYNNEFYQIDI